MASPTPEPRGDSEAPLTNFLRLPLGEKLLAAEAAACLAFARFLIVFVPLRRWNHGAGVGRAGPSQPPDRERLERAKQIARLVRLTARRLPFKAVCLPQAVAAQWMLRRRGLSGEIRLGARKPAPDLPLEMHAWLVYGDVVLTGGAQARAFTPLEPVKTRARPAADHDRGR